MEGVMEEVTLESTIEILRSDMIQAYKEKGNFVDSRVVHISQQLDTYIVQLQLLRRHS
ncbi:MULTISPECIES: aspartyl-phosphate phosphatase Spo0E family protein [Brevibacillus]|nr:aspartyl-phosphate phosphatase Spo0E family protein [Brevibacillus laterosporus]MCR8965296.1 aspartyl-phosphate phosphatase Spo0E family protein [Brevibacillus laterosporus]MCR8996640.1 aspartyl-phosphate phosphatase Spo0E family protein [Brevibacillus laterosporus]MCZ0837451.1 aspartyl-phosphate phosphatase Spo0E family protein [Brevibacillus halotolerans]WPS87265.1 aspartyl-phosphate phosphatase Spo0E family protein [Brevibacillus halotolerans]